MRSEWEKILGNGSFWVEEVTPSIEGLYPQEMPYIERMALPRQHEFACGRYCAHRALEKLGRKGEAVLRDEDGAPIWPEGVVGSITHSRGTCVAVVEEHHRLGGIGIDIESVSRCTANLLSFYAQPHEMSALQKSDANLSSDQCRALLFSAKEAAFKSFRSMPGRVGGLKSIQLEWLEDGEFRVSNVAEGRTRGRYFFAEGRVGAAVFVDVE